MSSFNHKHALNSSDEKGIEVVRECCFIGEIVRLKGQVAALMTCLEGCGPI